MDFYVIDKKPSGDEEYEKYRTEFYYDDKVKKGGALTCAKCGSFIGMLVPLPPYRVRLETWGRGCGDLAFWLDDFLASRRFRDAYVASELKGLEPFEAVEVLSCRKYRKLKDTTMPEYFRTMPSIGSARIDVVASGIEWGDNKQPECDVCLSGAGVLKRWKRVVVDESTWNGDDIFYPYGLPGTLIVTRRFTDWASNYEFKNLLLMPAAANSHDFYPMEKTTNHSS